MNRSLKMCVDQYVNVISNAGLEKHLFELSNCVYLYPCIFAFDCLKRFVCKTNTSVDFRIS